MQEVPVVPKSQPWTTNFPTESGYNFACFRHFSTLLLRIRAVEHAFRRVKRTAYIIKEKFTLEKVTKALKGIKGIALFFLYPRR
jgi:hypothetical protein